ncbi:hypothetical protein JCM10550A_07010 [Methanogenium cariaci]
MYLFLTGPNLASGGVRLDSITSPVVSGNAASFTRVPVRSGEWEYEWDTGRTGGTLDPGTYLIWVVPQPLNRYDLGDTSYATKSVLLTNPVLVAEIFGTDGTGGTEENAAETTGTSTPISGEKPFGDKNGLNTTSDEPEVTQDVSEDAPPLPTTAGLFTYPWVYAAGIAACFLLCVGGKKNK